MEKKPITRYHRILLKLTGELFGGEKRQGLDFGAIERIARDIFHIQQKTKTEIAVVIGAGNIFRGKNVRGTKVDKATADYMGMIATVMNGLALQEALERIGRSTRLMSSIEMKQICEPFIRRRAVRNLEKGRIVILAAGVGNPFFTTDTGAVLRAIELSCDVLLKATDVDGVYDSDPKLNKNAKRFKTLTYDKALKKGLHVMDQTAFALAKKEHLPIVVFNIDNTSDIEKIILGHQVGTLVSE